MKFDFDKAVERRGTGCVKWDEMPSPHVIPLWVADMDFAVAPAIEKAIKARAQHPVFGYTYVQDDYYEAVVSWYKRRHGWDIQREWIIYTTGVVPAVSAVLKALTMPGERVVTLTPAYNCFFSSIRNTGCELADCALQWSGSRFEIPWKELDELCQDERTSVLLLCNPHNPTGRVWTEQELHRIGTICRRNKVRVVSDEIHCELVMPKQHFTPMGYLDPTAVTLSSPSKSFNIAGLQIANIICKDADLRRRINRAININEVCDVNSFAPEAVKAAYNDSEEWLDELNVYIEGNYEALCSFCKQHLPQWRVMPLEGTYLAWVDCTSACGDNHIEDYTQRILEEAEVWLNPGTMYGTKDDEHYLRINLACPRSRLLEALERIAKMEGQEG